VRESTVTCAGHFILTRAARDVTHGKDAMLLLEGNHSVFEPCASTSRSMQTVLAGHRLLLLREQIAVGALDRAII